MTGFLKLRSVKGVTHFTLSSRYYSYLTAKCTHDYSNRTVSQPAFKLNPKFRRSYNTTASKPFYTNCIETISQSLPVVSMQEVLIFLHDAYSLSWWSTIIFSTIFLRSIITFPLAIYQQKIVARIENIGLEMPAIVEELKREAARAKQKFKWDDKQTNIVYRRSIKKQWTKLIVRDNCHPFKTLIVLWAQIPLWIFQSMALRNLIYMQPEPLELQAQIIANEMTVGGFGWMPNLIDVDHSYILPLALGCINLSIIEIQNLTRTREPTRFQRITTNIFRGLSVLMVPIACTVPSGLCLYWVTSSSYSLIQNLVLLSPNARRVFGIPKTAKELQNPYLNVWQKFQMRLGLETTSTYKSQSMKKSS